MRQPSRFAPAFALAFGLALAVRVAVAQAPPAWAYPITPPAAAGAPAPDAVSKLQLPGSRQQFTRAQLADLYSAPDWYPESRAPMPPLVAKGRKPDVYACGYCHTPGGQGRPENASLAGLPASYMLFQLADYASGARRNAMPGTFQPTDLMIRIAQHLKEGEATAAVEYFEKQKLRPRVTVKEQAQVPRSHIAGWMYVAEPGSAQEPLGQRLMEFAPDPKRHELRDERLRYVAYVPPGSIARGKALASTGATACQTCHGPKLQGIGMTPPLAGRMPGYLLRQLLAFKSGTRRGGTGLPMLAVTAQLDLPKMIDAVAYAASLPP